MDEENLDEPKNSVEFLEHCKRHERKTRHHKHRLHRCSRVLMVIAVVMLGYFAVRHFVHKRNMHRIEERERDQYSGRNHRLGASAEHASADYGATFSAISVAIWGMVVAKAKAGVQAATSEDVKSVGGLVKKMGVFCTLIAAASLL